MEHRASVDDFKEQVANLLLDDIKEQVAIDNLDLAAWHQGVSGQQVAI
jgi:hypothetical protein